VAQVPRDMRNFATTIHLLVTIHVHTCTHKHEYILYIYIYIYIHTLIHIYVTCMRMCMHVYKLNVHYAFFLQIFMNGLTKKTYDQDFIKIQKINDVQRSTRHR